MNKPDIKRGLTSDEVALRFKANLNHKDSVVKTKSIKDILRTNIITLFNIVNLTLGCFVFYTGEYKNLFFLGVVICNTLISLFQEIHAKRIIDKLSLIASTKVKLIRDGKEGTYAIEDIVKDDVIKFAMGNQVIVDSVIADGIVEVDESFITGESNYIVKSVGDMLLSGSFIVSGSCTATVKHISDENYINKISGQSKYIKEPNSQIFNTMRRVIKLISMVIIPLGVLLFLQQRSLPETSINDSILNTVAALVSMIPEGLILLTSTVLAVGAIRLARHRVLIQELHCIETLARVDTICLDKTGTLTVGKMKVEDTIILNNKYPVKEILTAIAHYNRDNNATALSLREAFNGETEYILKEEITFSSQRKYSGMEFDKGKYLLGAPEFLTDNKEILKKVDSCSKYRVLMLVSAEGNKKEPIALILISDVVRNNASKTIKYFYDQDVDVKIISGDSIKTNENIASLVGLKNIRVVDMSTINSEDNLSELVTNYNVFARVSPSQKKALILALKGRGKTVAMTGDGVNDVLALKEADCSIALSVGSDASKCVSGFVLLDSDFASLPKIVNEGRRAINNLERSATLFLTKTLYSTMLAILFLFVNMNYPFEPIQLTLNSVVAIGIPSFILALEPNHNRIRGNFIINVISSAIPAALTIVTNIVSVIIFASIFDIRDEYISTMSLFLLAFTGFQLLFKICYPFNYIRGILFGSLIGIFLGGVIGLRNLFDLVILDPHMFLFIGIIFLLDVILFNFITYVCERKIFKYRERIIGD